MSASLEQAIGQAQYRSALGRVANLQVFWVFLAAVLACTALSVMTDTFATERNLFNVGRNFAFVGIIAIGMATVIASGGIDLSVGSIVVLAAIRGDDEARAGNRDAIRRVVRGSTRHVVATTFTTIAGFLPLLLGGGGFWPPLAVTIAGGVSGATLLALCFSPAAYILLMCRECPVTGTSQNDAPVPTSVKAAMA